MPNFESKAGFEKVSYRMSPTASGDTNFTRTLTIPPSGAGYLVVGTQMRCSVVGSVVVQLVKATVSTPIGSGADLLASGMNTYAAASVNQYGNLIASTALQTLGANDGLGIRWGTQGALAPEGVFEVILQRR